MKRIKLNLICICKRDIPFDLENIPMKYESLLRDICAAIYGVIEHRFRLNSLNYCTFLTIADDYRKHNVK